MGLQTFAATAGIATASVTGATALGGLIGAGVGLSEPEGARDSVGTFSRAEVGGTMAWGGITALVGGAGGLMVNGGRGAALGALVGAGFAAGIGTGSALMA